MNEVEIRVTEDGEVPLLSTMPANGTHSRLPSPNRRGLHLVGRAWKADRTQSATASACGGMTFGLDTISSTNIEWTSVQLEDVRLYRVLAKHQAKRSKLQLFELLHTSETHHRYAVTQDGWAHKY